MPFPKNGRMPTPPHRVKHGTDAGYWWHRRNDPDGPCRACLDAHNEQTKISSRKRTAQRQYIRGILGKQRAYRELTNAEIDEVLKTIKKDLAELDERYKR